MGWTELKRRALRMVSNIFAPGPMADLWRKALGRYPMGSTPGGGEVWF